MITALLLVVLAGAPVPDAARAAGTEADGPAPREQQKLPASSYLRSGLDRLERARPEDQAEAERLFRKALALDPKLGAARSGLARASLYLYTTGIDETPQRLASALAEARKAVELSPSDPSAHATLALALAADDRMTPALEEARAAARDERSLEAQIALSVVLRLGRDLDGSLAAARRALALAPDAPRALVAFADALRELEQYAAAMEIYGQAIDLDHEALVPQLGAAATFVKRGNLPGARTAYRIILDQWSYARDRVRLGLAAMSVQAEDYEGALEQYGGMTIPDGHSLTALMALYGKGYSLLKLGRDAEAEYFLSTLLERAPSDYDGPARGREILFRAYGDLIDYFQERGRDRKAEVLLRSACDRPLAPTRLARRLAALLDQRGEPKTGAGLLEKAILRADRLEDPLDLTESLIDLMHRRSAAGRARGAGAAGTEACLRLVEERSLSSPLGLVHYRMARAWSLARDPQGALRSLERARDLGYLPSDLLAREADFDWLRQEPGFRALSPAPESPAPPSP